MSILGSLIVNLTAETSSFITGMSGASKSARSTGQEIEGAFSQLGSIASNALAPFGELGAVISHTLNEIGGSANTAVQAVAKMAPGLGAVGAIGAVGAAAVLALDAATIGLALHAAEGAAKLRELSQQTGVSVETLSGLGFAASQSGVATETLTKGLEKMSKSVFAAATAPVGAVNAYSRLGIALRDSEGSIRPVQDIFVDLADKFSQMPDGVTKTAIAMQIFGRGGAALIPVLNEGRDGIQEMISTASTLGLVISGETAEAAHKLEQNLGTLKAAGEGFENHLLSALLPSLLTVTSAMANFLKAPEVQQNIAIIINVLAKLVEFTVIVGETIFKAVQLQQQALRFLAQEFVALGQIAVSSFGAIEKAATGDFSGAFDQLKAGIAAVKTPFATFLDSGKKDWQEYTGFIKGLSAPLPNAKPQVSGGQVDITSKEGHRDIITEVIGKLRAQTAEEAALATAISDVAANTIIATAAAQAEKTIIETNARAKRENRQLTEAEKKEIKDLTLLQGAYREGAKDNKGLEDFIEKTQTQTKSLQALGAAYSANLPIAIEQAREAEKTAPFAKQITEIQGTIAALRAMGVTGAALAPLEASLVQLESKMARAKLAVHNLFVAEDTEKWGKAIQDLAQQKAAMDAFIPVALHGAGALREFNIQQQTEKFARENPALSQAQINEYRNSLRALEDDKVAMAAADRVAANQGFIATRQQIADLELLRQKQIAAGQDVTATDVLLYQTKTKAVTDYFEYVFQAQNAQLLGSAKIFDVQLQLIKQWDEAQFKVGTFSNRIKAVFNEISIQGKLAGSAIAQAFVSAFDGAETQLAHLIVTGKANFQNVLQSLEESIVKAGIQKTVGGILGGIGLNIPGLTPTAQLGIDPGHPMYVFAINGLGTNIGAGPIPTGSEGGGIGGPNLTGLGSTAGPLSVGGFVQGLNTMSAAQTAFAGRFNLSWIGIGANFLRHILVMTGLYHAHTAAVVASQGIQAGAVTAGQAAQTAATSAGAGARGNIGFAEHLKQIFGHAASAAAGAFSSVFNNPAIPFPINVILAPIAAAGAFAGVLAWGALGGKAKRGALLDEDGPIFAHKGELVIPANLSEGIQQMIAATRQGGNVPAVSQFAGSPSTSTGRGEHFHSHVNFAVSAIDTVGMAEQVKKQKNEILKLTRKGFQTGYLNPRRLARI